MSQFRPLDCRGIFSTGLAILALVTTACTQADGPGVKVKAIASDIVFDSDAPDPDAVPTLALPPAADGGFADLGGEVRAPVESKDDEPPPPRRRSPVTAPPQAEPECPAALATAFPREAATFDVPRVPAAGEYRWKRTISTEVAKKAVETAVFNRHQISNVSKVTETPNPATPDTPTRTFNFEETAIFENGSSLTGYQVKDNPPQGNVGLQTGEKANTGPPDRGVAITKTVVRDGSGKIVGTFNPSTPVLILPLPVAVPTEFESVGVDPTTGASYAVRGTVVGKERVDACGDVIDGWRVDSSQTFTSSDGRRHLSDVEYFVATQLGGIVIYQKAVAAEAVRDPKDPTVTDHIAQLDPTPVS